MINEPVDCILMDFILLMVAGACQKAIKSKWTANQVAI